MYNKILSDEIINDMISCISFKNNQEGKGRNHRWWGTMKQTGYMLIIVEAGWWVDGGHFILKISTIKGKKEKYYGILEF